MVDGAGVEQTEISRPARGIGSRLWLAFGASLALLSILVRAFVPYWETNDDVGMAMLAHGFGIAAEGSPRLVFSNVLWGAIVRAIPPIFQTMGYAWATLAVLVLAGAVIFYAVLRAGCGMWIAGLALMLVMVRPILFPQFTINSGLLCIAAIAAFRCHAHAVLIGERRAWVSLALGCVLALLSYLVRRQEFLLVAAVGAPLIPWRALLGGRVGRGALLALLLSIAGAAMIDRQSYRSDNWSAFEEANAARAPFTDFDAGRHLKRNPQILERHGLSSNDIDLVSNWFFADIDLIKPERLRALVAEVGLSSQLPVSMQGAWDGTRRLWHLSLIPLLAVAVVLLCLRLSKRVALTWLLTLTAAAAMGWMGRPGVTRVLVPLAALLALAPILVTAPCTGWRRRLCVATLVIGMVANTTQVVVQSRATDARADKLRDSMAQLSPQQLVVWGDAFPYELAFPVIGQSSAEPFGFYALGVFTRAPTSRAYAAEASGNGFLRRLQSTQGIAIVGELRLLETYCQEHLRTRLVKLESQSFSGFTLQRVRCQAGGNLHVHDENK